MESANPCPSFVARRGGGRVEGEVERSGAALTRGHGLEVSVE